MVKDVRLCNPNPNYNQNKQACRYNCGTDNVCNTSASDNQWRTVLVEGMGLAGSGYFAMDVTRAGGKTGRASVQPKTPDPVPLWEFDSDWERGEVAKLAAINPDLVYPKNSDVLGDTKDPHFIHQCSKDSTHNDYYWKQPFMGKSVSEAAIGTVAVKYKIDPNATDNPRIRRPVAVFSGGEYGEYGPDCDRTARVGHAIYVVDLQTGSLLRRFVSYTDPNDSAQPQHRFENAVVGSPALYDAFPGSLVTRGFVGDDQGRLFRIDMSSDDPAEWKVQLFFDPADPKWDSIIPDANRYGPASYKPALATGTKLTDGDLLVFYGLGERGDLNAGQQKQLMVALQEHISTSLNTSNVATATADAKYLWHVEFDEPTYDGHGKPTGGLAEKLTGAPVVFNRSVYFTTYVEPAAAKCEPGWSRIYGMKFEGKVDKSATNAMTLLRKPEGALDPTNNPNVAYHEGVNSDHNDGMWYYEPQNTSNLSQSVVVRGLTVTLGPSCSLDPTMTNGGMSGSGQRTPTLVAQTSAPADTMGNKNVGSTSGGAGGLTSIERNLDTLQSQHIPLSWAVIDN